MLQSADAGDKVAASIRDAAVDALARLAVSAGGGRLPIALSGGLLAPGRPLRDRVTAVLHAGPVFAADEFNALLHRFHAFVDDSRRIVQTMS